MVALSLQKLCDVLKQRDIESETLVCVRERVAVALSLQKHTADG